MRSLITKAVFATSTLVALAEGSIISKPTTQMLWKRQDTPPPIFQEEKCFDEADNGQGTVWGDKLQLLRDVWNDAFAGDFGGSLEVSGIKGVCCQHQCLFVKCNGDNRSWSTEDFGPAFDTLAGIVGAGEEGNGWCQAKVKGDDYLLMQTAQHDAISSGGTTIWETIGDTCAGAPGYIGTFG